MKFGIKEASCHVCLLPSSLQSRMNQFVKYQLVFCVLQFVSLVIHDYTIQEYAMYLRIVKYKTQQKIVKKMMITERVQHESSSYFSI